MRLETGAMKGFKTPGDRDDLGYHYIRRTGFCGSYFWP